MKKMLSVLAGLTLVLAITTAATGSVRGMVTGQNIKNYSVTSLDLKNHTIQAHDMSATLLNSLKQPAQSDYSIASGWAVDAGHSLSADSAALANRSANADNALKLDGRTPNELLRTARATQAAPLVLSGSYATLATLSIAAPGPGFVLVTSAANAAGDACPVDTPCTAVARLREVIAEGAASSTTAASVSSGNPHASLAATWVFPVGDAGMHTFVLEAYRTSPTSSEAPEDLGQPINVDGAVLTAIYVPFGSVGSSGL